MSKHLRSLVLGALVSGAALAEGPLTQADVVRAVVEHNPTVRASVADLQRTAEGVRAERARYRPRLLLDATAPIKNNILSNRSALLAPSP